MRPTGGVQPTQQNLEAWFKAGVVCVGMGSQLFKKEWIQNKDYLTLEQEISKGLALVQEIKNKS